MNRPCSGNTTSTTVQCCHLLIPVPINGSIRAMREQLIVADKLTTRHNVLPIGLGKSQFHAAICRAENATPKAMINAVLRIQI